MCEFDFGQLIIMIKTPLSVMEIIAFYKLVASMIRNHLTISGGMGDAKITCQGLNMNRLLVLVFTLLGVLCVTSGQVVQTGQCEQLTVTVSADFNIETVSLVLFHK